MTDPVNDDRCRASNAAKGADKHKKMDAATAAKGADKHKKMDAATSKALAEGAGGADKIAASCQRSQPGGTGTDGQEKPAQAGNHGHRQGGEPTTFLEVKERRRPANVTPQATRIPDPTAAQQYYPAAS
jgi:hypothetical protein